MCLPNQPDELARVMREAIYIDQVIERLSPKAQSRKVPNPEFCYTPERCRGRTCCPHNPACSE